MCLMMSLMVTPPLEVSVTKRLACKIVFLVCAHLLGIGGEEVSGEWLLVQLNVLESRVEVFHRQNWDNGAKNLLNSMNSLSAYLVYQQNIIFLHLVDVQWQESI